MQLFWRFCWIRLSSPNFKHCSFYLFFCNKAWNFFFFTQLKLCKGISYAAVAAHADKSGRRKLAALLVEHEPRSSKQVLFWFSCIYRYMLKLLAFNSHLTSHASFYPFCWLVSPVYHVLSKSILLLYSLILMFRFLSC